MKRFVILTHDHPEPHWDLILHSLRDADGDRCATWRLLGDPSSEQPVPAEPLPAHRAMYLDYEGPVSGGRGTVRRWDAGKYRMIRDDGEAILLEFEGGRIRGTYRVAESWCRVTKERAQAGD